MSGWWRWCFYAENGGENVSFYVKNEGEEDIGEG